MKDWRFLFNHYVHHAKKIDGLLWDWPEWGKIVEPQESFLNDLILRKGDSFIDVGANVGGWSIRASRYYSIVVALEPNRKIFRSLQRNIHLNKIRNIDARSIALDNTNGETEQHIYPSTPNTIGPEMGIGNVETITLDRGFLDLPVSVLKIDTEGAAFRIIQGGRQTILKHHPTIIIEVHTQSEANTPQLLPSYSWKKHYREAPGIGDWLYRENGKQVFLVGKP